MYSHVPYAFYVHLRSHSTGITHTWERLMPSTPPTLQIAPNGLPNVRTNDEDRDTCFSKVGRGHMWESFDVRCFLFKSF